MKIYTFKATQKLPISLDEAWKFLSDPKNLKLITPDYMGFITLSGDDRPMYPGQIIQYIVTPVLGIPMKWVTEITHVIDRQYFVDEQRFGPYSLWQHKHLSATRLTGQMHGHVQVMVNDYLKIAVCKKPKIFLVIHG